MLGLALAFRVVQEFVDAITVTPGPVHPDHRVRGGVLIRIQDQGQILAADRKRDPIAWRPIQRVRVLMVMMVIVIVMLVMMVVSGEGSEP